MTVGERVRVVRKDLKLNQTAFGESIGLVAATVSMIEHGDSRLTERTARAICSSYNVNYEWLMNGDGLMYKERTIEKESIVAGFAEVLDEYPSVCKVVLQLAGKMTAEDWHRVDELLADAKTEHDDALEVGDSLDEGVGEG